MAGFIHIVGLFAFFIGLYSWIRNKEVGWVNTRQRAALVFLAGIIFLGIGAYLKPVEFDIPESSPEPVEKENSVDVNSLLLSEDVVMMAVLGIEQYEDVIDAAIAQDEQLLSLVVKVSYATGPFRAQNLGDNFVRMVKTMSKDGEMPGVEIGRGEYDYMITVITPAGVEIADGHKTKWSRQITW